jgi:hypothetical protein
MRRLDARLAEHRVAHRLRLLPEAPAHVGLAAERLHHLDADDSLVRRFGHISLALLYLARERRDLAGEPQCEHRDRRHCNRGVERELRIDEHEHDPRAHDHQEALDALDQPPADEVANRIEVVRCARQHLAGRVAVIERARIPEIRLVEQLAHASFDPDPDASRRVAPREVDPKAQRGEGEDRDEVRPQRLRVVDDRVVDRLLREQRNRDRDQRVDEGKRDPEEAEPPLDAPEPEQPAECRQQAEVGRIDGVWIFGHGKWRRPPRLSPAVASSASTIARASCLEGGRE